MSKILAIFVALVAAVSIQTMSFFVASSHLSGGMDMTNGCPLQLMMREECEPAGDPMTLLSHYVESVFGPLTAIFEPITIVVASIILSVFVLIISSRELNAVPESFFWKRFGYWGRIIYISTHKFISWLARKFKKLYTALSTRAYTYS